MTKLLGAKVKQKLFFVQVNRTNKLYFEKENEAIALYKAFSNLRPMMLLEENVYDWHYKDLKESVSFPYKAFSEIILGQETIEIWSSKEKALEAKEKFIKPLKKK